MPLLRWADLNNDNNPLAELGRMQVSAMCELRRLDPFLFTSRLSSPLSPSFNTAPERFWNRICNPPPPFEQIRRPFGGQCVGILYDAQLFDEFGSPTPWINSSFGGPIPGPIVSASFSLQNPDPNDGSKFRGIAYGFTNEDGLFRGRTATDPAGAYLYDRRWSAALTRSDGLPDTCDNPPPPPPPPDPPPATRIIPVTINNQVTNFQVNLPDLVTNNWPDFTFSPIIELGGIKGEFNLEGINFPDLNFPDWPDVPLVDVDLNPTINAVANLDAVLQVGLGNLNVQIGNIGGSGDVDLTEIEALIRCCACEDGVTYEPVTISEGTNGDAFAVPADCVAISFLASMPFTPNTPTISRSGNEDDKLLWGSFAVGYAAGTAGISERLTYQSQSAPIAENAQTVTVTPHYGNTCAIIGIIKIKECL